MYVIIAICNITANSNFTGLWDFTSCNNIGSMAQVGGSVVQNPLVFTDTHIQVSQRIILLKIITLRVKSSFHDPMFDFHVPG